MLGAPYGIYQTADGHLALAMMDIRLLAKAIDCKPLLDYSQGEAFASRDEIKMKLAIHLMSRPANYWIGRLHKDGLWAMEVLDWEGMTENEAYRCLEMEQTINTGGKGIVTTRCPIRINGQRIFFDKPAPKLGEHTEQVVSDVSKSV